MHVEAKLVFLLRLRLVPLQVKGTFSIVSYLLQTDHLIPLCASALADFWHSLIWKREKFILILFT